MNGRRLVPYVTGLFVLAFALASLSRGSAGGSLLFQSTWLLYLIYLGPIAMLGLTIALVVFMAWNWRNFSEAIGFQAAKNRAGRKKRSRYSFIISLLVWVAALVVLVEKPGTIFNPQTNSSTTKVVTEITGGGGSPQNPFSGGVLFPTISSFVQNQWFSFAFLGLVLVGGMILVQSIRVSLRETSQMNIQEFEARRVEGLQATEDAIRSIDDTAADVRTRIIACYQHMMMGVSRLGVPVSPDQTARELEMAIRSAFMLQGSATHDLTMLFEEARYSLHSLDEEDAAQARQLLELIADELRTPNS
ncbi:DUF4129 domain-containing protein [Candidatus Bathyarchaeota archaeon]|nr:DUF4129 domain-containing protein [Candidatus Bathyarchaeota archaeon]